MNPQQQQQQQADPNAAQPVAVGIMPPRVMQTSSNRTVTKLSPKSNNGSVHGLPMRREVRHARRSGFRRYLA